MSAVALYLLVSLMFLLLLFDAVRVAPSACCPHKVNGHVENVTFPVSVGIATTWWAEILGAEIKVANAIWI